MGAWSEETFGNDAACDWLGEFLEKPSLNAVGNAIHAVFSEKHVAGDTACKCLAACEVIARLQGKSGLRDAYSEKLDAWVAVNPMTLPAGLKKDACAAIDKILSKKSELRELWDDGKPNDDWHKAVDDLRIRVKG